MLMPEFNVLADVTKCVSEQRAAEKGFRVMNSRRLTDAARARRRGDSSPSAFAVFRLTTSSYLVGACTGRSAGFVPLRMRSTKLAAWTSRTYGDGGHVARA